jgi:aldose sugar dehydrogenase
MRTAAHILRIAGCLVLLLVSLAAAPAQEHFRTADGIRLIAEPVVTGLHVPWSLAFSGNDLYFTERPGRISVLRRLRGSPVLLATLENVHASGEGGLMGLALDPSFASSHHLYVSYTYEDGGTVFNKVVRLTLQGNRLTGERTVVDRLPGGGVHNGCRLAFGPDGKLYITTGDAAHRGNAQDTSSLGGKILRVNADGSVPADNPFKGSPIWTLGHRNPQGIAWQSGSNLLFSSEHGPSGFDAPGGGDEINIIRAGKNYGWPIIHHAQEKEGLESPIREYTPAIAPSGITFVTGDSISGLKGDLLVATLRGEHLRRIIFEPRPSGAPPHEEQLFTGQFGRLRDVVQGPDGLVYFCTSNRDGRGIAKEKDDQILRLRKEK